MAPEGRLRIGPQDGILPHSLRYYGLQDRGDSLFMRGQVAKPLLLLGVLGMLWAASDQDQAFIGARGRYWAFQKVGRPATPAIRNPGVRNPIDAFILDGLEAKKIEPSRPLDRGQLIRRVTYDLTGL